MFSGGDIQQSDAQRSPTQCSEKSDAQRSPTQSSEKSEGLELDSEHGEKDSDSDEDPLLPSQAKADPSKKRYYYYLYSQVSILRPL